MSATTEGRLGRNALDQQTPIVEEFREIIYENVIKHLNKDEVKHLAYICDLTARKREDIDGDPVKLMTHLENLGIFKDGDLGVLLKKLQIIERNDLAENLLKVQEDKGWSSMSL